MTDGIRSEAKGEAARGRPAMGRTRTARRTSLFAHGEPMIWLTGGGLILALGLILWLLLLVLYQGGRTFWPRSVVELRTLDGRVYMGEPAGADGSWRPGERDFADLSPEVEERARERVEEQDGRSARRKLRTGNFDLTQTHYEWVRDFLVEEELRPEWAVVVERRAWGRFYGTPVGYVSDGERVDSTPEEALAFFRERQPGVLDRLAQRKRLEAVDLGRVSARIEKARLRLRGVELERGTDSEAWRDENQRFLGIEEECRAAFERLSHEIDALDTTNQRAKLVLRSAAGVEQVIGLDQIVRAYPANQLDFSGRLGVYVSRWWEFLSEEPRDASNSGGVLPAIFGTVAMTLLMCLIAVPFGVVAALYLREYARQGVLVSIVRIAVGNLAGVPSIVFGVFGLGFFCYIVGSRIDEIFFRAELPNPHFGKGGLMWASLTLALLTLPVVIVAAEEALSAVPNSMREGSYACGASKWQTIRRIVLPRAMPGILTGMILAVARGAGEVAPLMLVGAVSLAPELAVDVHQAPFVFPERSFMHLGYHIYELGFHSQNSEAAKPMVYTTTLLLITIVVLLNLVATWIRARLRRQFVEAT